MNKKLKFDKQQKMMKQMNGDNNNNNSDQKKNDAGNGKNRGQNSNFNKNGNNNWKKKKNVPPMGKEKGQKRHPPVAPPETPQHQFTFSKEKAAQHLKAKVRAVSECREAGQWPSERQFLEVCALLNSLFSVNFMRGRFTGSSIGGGHGRMLLILGESLGGKKRASPAAEQDFDEIPGGAAILWAALKILAKAAPSAAEAAEYEHFQRLLDQTVDGVALVDLICQLMAKKHKVHRTLACYVFSKNCQGLEKPAMERLIEIIVNPQSLEGEDGEEDSDDDEDGKPITEEELRDLAAAKAKEALNKEENEVHQEKGEGDEGEEKESSPPPAKKKKKKGKRRPSRQVVSSSDSDFASDGDEGEDSDGGPPADIDPELVKDVKRALGRAAFIDSDDDEDANDQKGENNKKKKGEGNKDDDDEEDEEEEEEPQLSDSELFKLDEAISAAFLKHSQKHRRQEMAVHRGRLLDLLTIYFSTAPIVDCIALVPTLVKACADVSCEDGELLGKLSGLFTPLNERKKDVQPAYSTIVQALIGILNLFNNGNGSSNPSGKEGTEEKEENEGETEEDPPRQLQNKGFRNVVAQATAYLFSLACDHQAQGVAEVVRKFFTGDLLERALLKGGAGEGPEKSQFSHNPSVVIAHDMVNAVVQKYPAYIPQIMVHCVKSVFNNEDKNEDHLDDGEGRKTLEEKAANKNVNKLEALLLVQPFLLRNLALNERFAKHFKRVAKVLAANVAQILPPVEQQNEGENKVVADAEGEIREEEGEEVPKKKKKKEKNGETQQIENNSNQNGNSSKVFRARLFHVLIQFCSVVGPELRVRIARGFQKVGLFSAAPGGHYSNDDDESDDDNLALLMDRVVARGGLGSALRRELFAGMGGGRHQPKLETILGRFVRFLESALEQEGEGGK